MANIKDPIARLDRALPDELTFGSRMRMAIPSWWAPALLVIAALALRLWCFTGLIGSDDLLYTHYARAIVSGTYALEAYHFALRFGLFVPLAGIYGLFGVSEWSTALLPLTASVVCVVLTFWIARTIFGPRAAFFAALLATTFPLSIRYGSILLPEPVAGMYVLGALALYVSLGKRREVTAGLAAGLLLGIGYLTREIVVFILLAVLAETALQRRWRLLTALAVGSFAVAFSEHLYYWLASGDVLLRLHGMASHNAHQKAFEAIRHPIYRLTRTMPEIMLIPSIDLGLHSVLAVVLALIATLVFPFRQIRLFVLWAVIPALYLNFGSTSLSTYIPMVVSERYLDPIYPPLFVLSGAVLSKWATTRFRMAAVAAVLTLVSVVGIRSAYVTRGTGWRTAEVSQLRSIAKQASRTGTPIARIEGPAPWRLSMEVIAPRELAPSSAKGLMIRENSQGLPVAVPLSTEERQESGATE
jgi:4-amino-4-deoxy-L-arabinose transferase-like glycosyltransferase